MRYCKQLPLHQMLVRIEAKHFVAGVVLDQGRITEAAPIVKYMRGWDLQKVASYCGQKGWEYATVEEGDVGTRA